MLTQAHKDGVKHVAEKSFATNSFTTIEEYIAQANSDIRTHYAKQAQATAEEKAAKKAAEEAKEARAERNRMLRQHGYVWVKYGEEETRGGGYSEAYWDLQNINDNYRSVSVEQALAEIAAKA